MLLDKIVCDGEIKFVPLKESAKWRRISASLKMWFAARLTQSQIEIQLSIAKISQSRKIMLTRFGISGRLPDKHAKMDYSTSMSVMAPLLVCALTRTAKTRTAVTARESRKDQRRAISKFQQKEIS